MMRRKGSRMGSDTTTASRNIFRAEQRRETQRTAGNTSLKYDVMCRSHVHVAQNRKFLEDIEDEHRTYGHCRLHLRVCGGETYFHALR